MAFDLVPTAATGHETSADDHDVIGVKGSDSRGTFCRLFVDGVSTGTARLSHGRLSITGDYPETSFGAVAAVIAAVLGGG